MKRAFLIASAIFTLFHAQASDSVFRAKNNPTIEGTIRAKYEYNTNLDAHRFQVRNARFNLNGSFSPVVSYKTEIDLSDEGKIRMLDAYIRLKPANWLAFTLGQQKIPFSTDNLRAPHRLYFANRSFIGKQLTGLRDVGATMLLTNKKAFPFDFAVGVYNGKGLYEQQNWGKNDMSFAARWEIFPVKNVEISLNFNSVKPETIRMNCIDVGFYTDMKHFHFETEYFYKHYPNNIFEATHGFFVFGAYNFMLNKPYLTKITPLLRYDMMTDNNKGRMDQTASTYVVNDAARSRVTGGVTFSLNKPFMNDIRLNYEKYFFDKNIADDNDKLVLEFVVRF